MFFFAYMCSAHIFVYFFAVTAQLPSGIAYFSKSGILVNPLVKSHCTTVSLMYVTQGPHLDIPVICVLFCCDHQDGKADVILRYNPDEARNLKAYGELPDNGTVHSIAVGKYFFYVKGTI